MITQQYIDTFKKTSSFNIISEGLLKGDIEKVLLGKGNYRITSQYETEDTVPSQVLIGIHILLLEGKLFSDKVNEAFKQVSVNLTTVCLLLNYLDTYIIYRQSHNDIMFDYLELLSCIKNKSLEFQKLPCFNRLMSSIENNMLKNQS